MLTFTRITATTTQAQSHRPVLWKCNGLIVETEKEAILIDCNFDRQEMEELFNYINKPVSAYFITHMHIDHVNNLYVIESLGIKIYAPVPENKYPGNIDLFFKHTGSAEMGMSLLMRKFTLETLGYREVKSIAPYTPGESFNFGVMTIETIALPGHSPGHSGFIIHETGSTGPDVLFASDIGLDAFGAWYGFKYCSLSDYRCSLQKVRNIYSSGDYILTSSHKEPQAQKEPAVFERIFTGINDLESRLKGKLDPEKPVLLDDITLTGIYYRRSSIDKMNEFLKKLYFFWEYFTLQNHLHDLDKRGVARELNKGEWILRDEPDEESPFLSIDDGSLCVNI